MARRSKRDFRLDNISVAFEGGICRVKDNDSGEVFYATSFNQAIRCLKENVKAYRERPEEVARERREQAAETIRDMIHDESVMCILMTGLVSADNNLTLSDIRKNIERFEQLKSGIGLVSPANEAQKERLEWIAGLIEDGLEILKKDEVRVPVEERLEEILGPEVLYKTRKIYESYFDPEAAAEACRDRYITEMFGECTEPTYDPIWNVWYLGWYDEDLKLHYHVGSDTEILEKYKGSSVWGEDRRKD